MIDTIQGGADDKIIKPENHRNAYGGGLFRMVRLP
jgi:hypothetical protein